MATTIKLKSGSGAPTSGQLVSAEPALDLTNKRLYTENASGTVIEVGTNPSSLTIGGTALTATAAELNTLDGITATTAELNTLDGITATVTELNYTDGVTSNIQTQLNTKAPIASPTFTGTVTAPAVNVNGTVTADGLTVENAGGSAKAVIKSTTTAGGQTQYLNASTGTTGFLVGLLGDTSGNGTLYHQDAKDILVYTGGLKRANFGSGGDISFYEDTGTTAKLFWDASAESLGIGHSTPSATYGIDVSGKPIRVSAAAPAIEFQETDAANQRWSMFSIGGDFTIRDITGGGYPLYIEAGAPSASLRVDNTGNVGIGTTSPSTHLDVTGGTTNQVAIFRSSDATATIGFADNTTPLTGNLSYVTVGAVGNNMVFNTNLAERMRIDSSGNLLVGKTSADGSAGVQVSGDGYIYAIANGAQSGYFRRLTSDGEIVRFLKDTTTVGSIGSRVGEVVYIQSGQSYTGLDFSSSILPRKANALNDAGVDLGTGTYRFKDLYLSGEVKANGVTSSDVDLTLQNSADGIYFGSGFFRPYSADDAVISLGLSTARWKDLYLSGGVYLGGTGAANKLDDYEEGTWTPTAASYDGTMTVNSATYVKIGSLVTVKAKVSFDATSDGSGVNLSNLPFVTTGTDKANGGFIVSSTVSSAARMQAVGTASLMLLANDDSNVTYTTMASTSLEFVMIYETTA